MGMLILLVAIAAGIALGMALIRKAGRQAQASGTTRDRIVAPRDAHTLDTIAQWADAHGYAEIDSGEGLKLYRKGNAVASGAQAFLSVAEHADGLLLESYVRASGVMRGDDMPLSAPGIVLAMPRKTARRAHDALRDSLGLPHID